MKAAHLKAHPVKHKSLNGPYNMVTTTSPGGGTKVAQGSTVTLNYNVRPGSQTLPDVSGLSVSDADGEAEQGRLEGRHDKPDAGGQPEGQQRRRGEH